MRRVGTEQTATLPADYVAAHVELSYALTGYGAQGLTVTTALAVVQPGDEHSYAYVAATRGTDTNIIRVVTETIDDEPAGHHPERSVRDVLGTVLANEPAVIAGHALHTAAAHQHDTADLFNRHRHTTRTIAEQTVASVLEARGAQDLLAAPDAWLLIDETERATERGLDPAAILAAASDTQLASVDEATRVLGAALPDRRARGLPDARRRARPRHAAHHPTRRRRLPRRARRRLTRRHDTLTAEFQTGPAPTWAATLGQPPPEPAARARWADAVARVALWREAHAMTTDDPLGPSSPIGHRDGAARGRAAIAADQAVELARDKTPGASRHLLRHDVGHDQSPTPTPTRDQGARLDR